MNAVWPAVALFVVASTVCLAAWSTAGIVSSSSVVDKTSWIVRSVADVNQLFNVTAVDVQREGDMPQLRVYRPATLMGSGSAGGGASTLAPVFVFIHGGGWVNGSVESYDAVMRGLTGRLDGFVVISVGYRLAPAVPFPAPLLDCVAALQWTAAHAADYGGDVRRIAIGGDSAGGNLAAATVLALFLQAQAPAAPTFPPLWPPPPPPNPAPQLCAQWLVYPVMDARMASGTYTEFSDGPGTLTAARMAFYWNSYLQNGLDAWNIFASPGLATPILQGLHASSVAAAESAAAVPAWAAAWAAAGGGFPATLVQTAEQDVLRAEGEIYASALAAAGARARWIRYDGETHAFLFRLWNPDGLDINMPAWTEAVAFLQGECGLS